MPYHILITFTQLIVIHGDHQGEGLPMYGAENEQFGQIQSVRLNEKVLTI